MAWRCLHSILKDAAANDTYEQTWLEVYELDSIDDFNDFLFACKKKNTMVAEKKGNRYVYFIVDSNNITKRQPMPGGRVQVELTIKLRYFRSLEELLAPWELPAFNFRMSGGLVEESASKFYPGDDDLWYEEDDSPEGKNFVNTAGVMLEGTATYSTTQISFSYAVAVDTFLRMQDWFWALMGKINCDTPIICGMRFPKRTLKIDSLNAEYCEVQKPGLMPTRIQQRGANVYIYTTVVDTLYKYYRIDATFSANPRTWNQYFLNVGTHVKKDGMVQRLWYWYDQETQEPRWGTYKEYRASGADNGEAVTEPVALNANGDGAESELDEEGRQVMTYRHGSLYEPIPFGDLAFPEALPMKWAYGS